MKAFEYVVKITGFTIIYLIGSIGDSIYNFLHGAQ
jgi:hypothetical protein